MWMRCKVLQEAMASCPLAESAWAQFRSGRACLLTAFALAASNFEAGGFAWINIANFLGR